MGTLDTVKFSNIKMIIAGTHSMNYTKYLPPGADKASARHCAIVYYAAGRPPSRSNNNILCNVFTRN